MLDEDYNDISRNDEEQVNIHPGGRYISPTRRNQKYNVNDRECIIDDD